MRLAGRPVFYFPAEHPAEDSRHGQAPLLHGAGELRFEAHDTHLMVTRLPVHQCLHFALIATKAHKISAGNLNTRRQIVCIDGIT